MEFLRYPHLIATFFNRCAFGPPPPFTAASTWTWVGHPVSGLCLLTWRPIKTRFPFGSGLFVLNLASNHNSPDRSTKSTQSELLLLLLFVSTRFQVLFHSPPGVLFTFPSQYFSTIGHRLVFRLGGWSPRLPTGFLVSRGTLDPARCPLISLTGLSPSAVCFPKTVQLSSYNTVRSPQPRWTRSFGLASFLFARRY